MEACDGLAKPRQKTHPAHRDSAPVVQQPFRPHAHERLGLFLGRPGKKRLVSLSERPPVVRQRVKIRGVELAQRHVQELPSLRRTAFGQPRVLGAEPRDPENPHEIGQERLLLTVERYFLPAALCESESARPDGAVRHDVATDAERGTPPPHHLRVVRPPERSRDGQIGNRLENTRLTGPVRAG